MNCLPTKIKPIRLGSPTTDPLSELILTISPQNPSRISLLAPLKSSNLCFAVPISNFSICLLLLSLLPSVRSLTDTFDVVDSVDPLITILTLLGTLLYLSGVLVLLGCVRGDIWRLDLPIFFHHPAKTPFLAGVIPAISCVAIVFVETLRPYVCFAFVCLLFTFCSFWIKRLIPAFCILVGACFRLPHFVRRIFVLPRGFCYLRLFRLRARPRVLLRLGYLPPASSLSAVYRHTSVFDQVLPSSLVATVGTYIHFEYKTGYFHPERTWSGFAPISDDSGIPLHGTQGAIELPEMTGFSHRPSVSITVPEISRSIESDPIESSSQKLPVQSVVESDSDGLPNSKLPALDSFLSSSGRSSSAPASMTGPSLPLAATTSSTSVESGVAPPSVTMDELLENCGSDDDDLSHHDSVESYQFADASSLLEFLHRFNEYRVGFENNSPRSSPASPASVYNHNYLYLVSFLLLILPSIIFFVTTLGIPNFGHGVSGVGKFSDDCRPSQGFCYLHLFVESKHCELRAAFGRLPPVSILMDYSSLHPESLSSKLVSLGEHHHRDLDAPYHLELVPSSGLSPFDLMTSHFFPLDRSRRIGFRYVNSDSTFIADDRGRLVDSSDHSWSPTTRQVSEPTAPAADTTALEDDLVYLMGDDVVAPADFESTDKPLVAWFARRRHSFSVFFTRGSYPPSPPETEPPTALPSNSVVIVAPSLIPSEFAVIPPTNRPSLRPSSLQTSNSPFALVDQFALPATSWFDQPSSPSDLRSDAHHPDGSYSLESDAPGVGQAIADWFVMIWQKVSQFFSDLWNKMQRSDSFDSSSAPSLSPTQLHPVGDPLYNRCQTPPCRFYNPSSLSFLTSEVPGVAYLFVSIANHSLYLLFVNIIIGWFFWFYLRVCKPVRLSPYAFEYLGYASSAVCAYHDVTWGMNWYEYHSFGFSHPTLLILITSIISILVLNYPVFVRIPYMTVRGLDFLFIGLNVIGATAHLLGYCYLSPLPSELSQSAVNSLGSFPTLTAFGSFCGSSTDVTLPPFSLETQGSLSHVTTTSSGEAVSDFTAPGILGANMYTPHVELQREFGYCYVLAVVHSARSAMAGHLGPNPTIERITSYIADNNISLNTNGFDHQYSGGVLHLVEPRGRGGTLDQLVCLYGGHVRVGARLASIRVKLYEPYQKHARLSELLTCALLSSVIDVILVWFMGLTVNARLRSVCLIVMILVAVISHVYLIASFALSVVRFCLKLAYNIRYRNVRNILDFDNLSYHYGNSLVGSESGPTSDSDVLAAGSPSTSYPAATTMVGDTPPQESRFLKILPSTEILTPTDITIDISGSLVDSGNLFAANFAVDANVPCDMSNHMRGVRYSRNKKHTTLADANTGKPAPQPVVLPGPAIPFLPPADDNDSLDAGSEPSATEAAIEKHLPSLADSTLQPAPDNSQGKNSTGRGAHKNRKGKSSTTQTFTSPNLGRPDPNAPPSQPHPSDYLDILAGLPWGDPRNIVPMEHTPVLGFLPLVPMVPRAGLVVSTSWDSLANGSAPLSLGADFKSAPSNPGRVRTRDHEFTSLVLASNISSAQTTEVINQFSGKGVSTRDGYNPSDPFKQALVEGLRGLIMEQIGPDQTVLVIGDDATFYDADGYTYCAGPHATGMFHDDSVTRDQILQATKSDVFYAVDQADITVTNIKYSVVVAMFPNGYDLSVISRHAARVGATSLYITSLCGPNMYDKLGLLPTMGLHYCLSEPRNSWWGDGSCSITFTSTERDGTGWVYDKCQLDQFNETQLVYINANTVWQARKTFPVSDVMLSKYVLTNNPDLRITSCRVCMDRSATYSITTSPYNTVRGWWSETHDCEVLMWPAKQTTSFISQAKKQNDPIAESSTSVANNVAPGFNKFLTPNLQNATLEYTRSPQAMDCLIKVAKAQRNIVEEELNQHKHPLLSRLNGFGNVSQLYLETMIRTRYYLPQSQDDIPLRYMRLNRPIDVPQFDRSTPAPHGAAVPPAHVAAPIVNPIVRPAVPAIPNPFPARFDEPLPPDVGQPQEIVPLLPDHPLDIEMAPIMRRAAPAVPEGLPDLFGFVTGNAPRTHLTGSSSGLVSELGSLVDGGRRPRSADFERSILAFDPLGGPPFSRTTLKLGDSTNKLLFDQRPLMLSTILTAEGKYGKYYCSNEGTIQECVFNNPRSLFSTDPMAMIQYCVEAFPTLLIHKNCYTFTHELTENASANYNVIHITDDGRFNLLCMDRSMEAFMSSDLSSLLQVDYTGVRRFLVASQIHLTDVVGTLCFYRAARVSNPDIIAGGDKVCPSHKIRELSMRLGVVIVSGDRLYVPRGFHPSEITRAVFAIAANTHCYACDWDLLKLHIREYKVVNMDMWSQDLNGPMHLCPAHSVSDSDFSSEVATTRQVLDNLRKVKEHIDSGKHSYRVNAILEYVQYCLTGHYNILSAFELILTKDPDSYYRAMTHHSVYDLSNLRFLSTSRVEGKDFAWNGEQVITIKWDKKTRTYSSVDPKHAKNVVVLSNDQEFLRDGAIATRTMQFLPKLLYYDFAGIRVDLLDGVPGCGKTYQITQRHNLTQDMVATATNEAKTDYHARLKSRKNYNARRYRTYDSINIHGALNCSILHADEGYMVHFGQLLLVAYETNASSIQISGDTKQLPFISRCYQFMPRYHIPRYDKITLLLVTRRMPQRTKDLFKVVYPGITTISNIVDIPAIVRILTTPIIPDRFDTILTFTQAEKSALKSLNPGRPIFTVHEKQGYTGRNVLIVRTKIQSDPIYDSAPHIIVACSRHTHSIEYWTVDEEDKTSRFLSGNVTSVEMMPEPPEEMVDWEYYSVGSPSRQYSVISSMGEKTRLTSSLGSWLMGIMNLSGQSTVDNADTRYTFEYSPTLYESINYDVAEVQTVIDLLYDRWDEDKLKAMLEENPFPLPSSYEINWDQLSVAMQGTKGREFCSPKLSCPVPPRDKGTLMETLAATRKRNENPPMLNVVRPKNVAKKVVDVFMDTYIDKDRLAEAFANFPYDNVMLLSEFLETRQGDQLRKMEGLNYLMNDPSKYSAHLKPVGKVILTNSHNVALFAGQVLGVHHPYTTAYFSAPIRNLSHILRYSLKKNFIINEKLNQEELNGHINHALWPNDQYKFLEVDFSKFDKSQDDLTLETNLELMRRFGVPELIIDEWEACHTTSKLVFQKWGIKLETAFQRKSGDVFTFMGNTVTSMLAIAFVYDLSDVTLAVFGGDDSLIATRDPSPIPDRSKLLAEVFNLEAKLDNYPYGHYFSSRFLLFVNGKWLFVPDPLKAIFKLGRDDMYCEEHAREFHTSYADNYKLYLCSEVRRMVSDAAYRKYKKYFLNREIEIGVLTEFLGSLVDDQDKFVDLFEGPEELWNRAMTPDLRKEFKKREMQIEEFVESMDDDLVIG